MFPCVTELVLMVPCVADFVEQMEAGPSHVHLHADCHYLVDWYWSCYNYDHPKHGWLIVGLLMQIWGGGVICLMAIGNSERVHAHSQGVVGIVMMSDKFLASIYPFWTNGTCWMVMILWEWFFSIELTGGVSECQSDLYLHKLGHNFND